MNIKTVNEILSPYGLLEPRLNALVPDERNYKALLIQPEGNVEGSTEGVWNRDRELARRQFKDFLNDAISTGADLAISPEYSLPWDSLTTAIKEGGCPASGKLWALGCESIKYSALERLRTDFAPNVTVIFETLEPESERFLDPLVYVFKAPSSTDEAKESTILLVQFKTHPMGDDDHFEISGLQRGTTIYQFGGTQDTLKLVSLICSDAFAFMDADAKAVYDRALILHIQLNRQPRHEQYRQYRVKLLQFKGHETELICLNWARNVTEWCDNKATPWKNASASAWYLRPENFDDRDATLAANHKRGLYYTWLDPQRAHTMFFNFTPAIYLIEATKVAHIGVTATVSRRRGPQLRRVSVWDDSALKWYEQSVADDGFSAIVSESGGASSEIKRLADSNPLWAERVLALCAGKMGYRDDWYRVQRLDSCVLDSTEVIYRITFSQDTKQIARDFRIGRLKRCSQLWEILRTERLLPPALADFRQGFRFEWSLTSPHQNAASVTDKRATVIYLGEETSADEIERVTKTTAEFLHRSFTSPDDSLTARQRLAVWFRDHNEIALYDPNRLAQYDEARNTSEFDIAREA